MVQRIQESSTGLGRHRSARGAQRPETLQQTGLTLGFLNDMILRTLYTTRRHARPGPGPAALPAVQGHRGIARLPQEREVHRGARRRPDRPHQLPLQPDRAGPAPRPGRDEDVRLRRPRPGAAGGLRRADLPPGRHRHHVSPEALRAAFSHLVISDELFNAVGPAIVSGKSVFIYGPPGNGKTSMAQAIGNFMNSSGGEIYVPYAFLAEEQHHHRLRPGRPRAGRGRGRRPPGGQRGHHPPAAQHRHRRSALGQHPPAGHHHRRRTEPGHARPALQPRVELLPGAAARQGQRRHLPDRRLRPAAVQPQGAAQPLDRAAGKPHRLTCRWPPARSSRCRSSS